MPQDQKWRVALGIQNGGHHHNLSFVTRHELVQNHWPRAVDENEIPKRTLFYKTSMDLLFHSHYRFEMDWEERYGFNPFLSSMETLSVFEGNLIDTHSLTLCL